MTSASPPGDGERREMAKPLGEALRRARERRGLTAVEVAEAIKSAPHSVAWWEVGVAVPRLDSLGRLATVLALGLGDLNGLFAVEDPHPLHPPDPPPPEPPELLRPASCFPARCHPSRCPASRTRSRATSTSRGR